MIRSHQLIDLGLATSLPELNRRAEQICADIGFGLFQGVWVRGRFGSATCSMLACGNPPDAFYESARSLDEGTRDPLLQRLLAQQGHFSYDHRLYVDAGARDLYDHQAEFGFKHGMALSLHQTSHEEAYLFGVDRPDPLSSNAGATLRLQGALTLLALHLQAAMQRIARPAPGAEIEPTRLTQLEIDAVRKTSTTLYRPHGHLVVVESSAALTSAAAKLGASTAAGVVLKAIDGGLIQP